MRYVICGDLSDWFLRTLTASPSLCVTFVTQVSLIWMQKYEILFLLEIYPYELEIKKKSWLLPSYYPGGSGGMCSRPPMACLYLWVLVCLQNPHPDKAKLLVRTRGNNNNKKIRIFYSCFFLGLPCILLEWFLS